MVGARLRNNSLQLLQDTLDFWVLEKRFSFVDLPWTAERQYLEATRPVGAPDAALDTHYGQFVCSGEQSFIALWDQKRLAPAAGYIGWTPCIRNEPLDELHQYGFMKAELFCPVEAPEEGLALVMGFLQAQKTLFARLAATHLDARIARQLETVSVASNQWDINVGGIEVGSYGWREFKGQLYAYGTALAEPRFSIAVKRTVG